MDLDEAQRRWREERIAAALEAFIKAGGERHPARAMEAALTAVAFWEAATMAATVAGGLWKPKEGWQVDSA